MIVLYNITRNKSNQTKKFGQLIECNMRNIFFLKNHTQNGAGKLVPDTFITIKFEYISGSKAWILYSLFQFYVQILIYQNTLNLRRKLLVLTLYNAFFEKRSLELISVAHFLYHFWWKYFSRYILLADQISLLDCL